MNRKQGMELCHEVIPKPFVYTSLFGQTDVILKEFTSFLTTYT